MRTALRERIDYKNDCMIRNGRHIYNRVDIHAKEKNYVVFDIRHLPDLYKQNSVRANFQPQM